MPVAGAAGQSHASTQSWNEHTAPVGEASARMLLALMRGEVPAYLEPMSGHAGGLQIFRVKLN